MRTQSGGLEAPSRSQRESIPPSLSPPRCKRAGRSVRGITGVVRSVRGSWSVGVDGEVWMDVTCFSGPSPCGAAVVMDPALYPAKPPYPARRYRVGTVQCRSRPGTTVCGEALNNLPFRNSC